MVLKRVPLAVLTSALCARSAIGDDAPSRTHWSFRPLAEVAVPESAVPNVAAPETAEAGVTSASRARTPIDRFILASLAARGLSLSAPATPRRLVRRMHCDVIGLPPSPAEVDAFLRASERDPDRAVEELVDRLLASPHFGERQARHWLDVARYADSDGQEADRDRPGAYHYRDFVIRALGDDMPFDRFVRLQIAGDELEPASPQAIAATGFLTAGPHTVLEDTFLEEERLRNRYNELDDILSTMGTALLGLTIGCSRCHDHKFDAIPARDYYRLLGAFHSGDRREVAIGHRDDAEKILAFGDFGAERRATWLFERADFYDRDDPVELGFLTALTRDKSAADYLAEARASARNPSSTQQRSALAAWLTDVEHGAGALLARVIVNRIWQHHFGQGIVRTSGDFGTQGQAPSHPELLEWLALDLVAHSWRLKRLHRMILTSAVYRQSSAFDESAARVDPDNTLLWRRTPGRIEAEVLRDAILVACGKLVRDAFGPGFKPPVPAEAMTARNLQGPEYPKDAADGPETHRRSIYMFHKRVIPYPLFQAFDRPDALQSCSRRQQTTVAPQALALLNDVFVRARAVDLADRLIADAGDADDDAVARGFELALCRPPSATERSASLEFVRAQIESRRKGDAHGEGDARREALADFAQVLFGLNEFLWVD